MRPISRFQDLIPSVRGAEWADEIRKRLFGDEPRKIDELCELIMQSDGEYSSLLISDRILAAFEALGPADRVRFFQTLNTDYDLDPGAVRAAADAYARTPDRAALEQLSRVCEARRQELFRRLNLATGATTRLVKMREALLALVPEHPELAKMDADFRHLFQSWFNRGFLSMHPVDWTTPAHILEKIIAYEAVHEIGAWNELRRRLEPRDRHCYAFFHPAMPDEPLVFVEVALTERVPRGIGEILDPDREVLDPAAARRAVFYSISNCHAGLAGVSFGNFLIKQVANDLKQRFPNLKTFATLSPVPGLCAWLAHESDAARGLIERLTGATADQAGRDDAAQLERLAARYFLEQDPPGSKPRDPVARFHLKNGARLERINLFADPSAKGMRQSLGVMVNYVYDLARVEENHEKYMRDHGVVSSSKVRKLLP